ncbi:MULTISPECIES: AgrD family cyclic lactone autoinducer peptide [Clostridium]|uniref:Cyclic lactone autoinducer peptide n=3 Tax=Clostridium TaxID=1485 RepID=C6PMP7_9CLOT|nr:MULTISPECIES: cyclic lactone autoinducer peptide [Clostridium]AKA69417.1 hypothetical protein CSCA_2292 [Clostridium scatologenes]AWI04471.1 cyclic lactone autoinducer peptide [Clostridium drakei]EET89446.1 hypothetical protein CcarbDRAFT_0035 [Clostridium carboxidivorans P7]
MKKLFNSFKVKSILCVLPLFLGSFLTEKWPNCFIYIGEPEIPECLKKH